MKIYDTKGNELTERPDYARVTENPARNPRKKKLPISTRDMRRIRLR